MAEGLIHGCALACGRRGILITGKSGSGKTSLGHELLRRDSTAIWVADDQVLLSTRHNALIARPPQELLGRAERPFLGIESVAQLAATRLDLIVELIEEAQLERMPHDCMRAPLSEGPELPVVKVPCRSASLSSALVLSALNRLG